MGQSTLCCPCHGPCLPRKGSWHCCALQDGWEHLPHDLLVAIVKHLGPRDAKSMHRACLSWHLAVRCGLQSMHPAPKITPFPDIRDYFPRVRTCAADASSIPVSSALQATWPCKLHLVP